MEPPKPRVAILFTFQPPYQTLRVRSRAALFLSASPEPDPINPKPALIKDEGKSGPFVARMTRAVFCAGQAGGQSEEVKDPTERPVRLPLIAEWLCRP